MSILNGINRRIVDGDGLVPFRDDLQFIKDTLDNGGSVSVFNNLSIRNISTNTFSFAANGLLDIDAVIGYSWSILINNKLNQPVNISIDVLGKPSGEFVVEGGNTYKFITSKDFQLLSDVVPNYTIVAQCDVAPSSGVLNVTAYYGKPKPIANRTSNDYTNVVHFIESGTPVVVLPENPKRRAVSIYVNDVGTKLTLYTSNNIPITTIYEGETWECDYFSGVIKAGLALGNVTSTAITVFEVNY